MIHHYSLTEVPKCKQQTAVLIFNFTIIFLILGAAASSAAGPTTATISPTVPATIQLWKHNGCVPRSRFWRFVAIIKKWKMICIKKLQIKKFVLKVCLDSQKKKINLHSEFVKWTFLVRRRDMPDDHNNNYNYYVITLYIFIKIEKHWKIGRKRKNFTIVKLLRAFLRS